MDAKAVYGILGEDYEEVLSRLVTDERIVKYLKRFAEGDGLASLDEYLNQENYEEAFRLVHSLKGMAMNMGLTKLAYLSSVLCEELRDGKPNKPIDEMIVKVENEFARVKENISLIA